MHPFSRARAFFIPFLSCFYFFFFIGKGTRGRRRLFCQHFFQRLPLQLGQAVNAVVDAKLMYGWRTLSREKHVLLLHLSSMLMLLLTLLINCLYDESFVAAFVFHDFPCTSHSAWGSTVPFGSKTLWTADASATTKLAIAEAVTVPPAATAAAFFSNNFININVDLTW